MSDEYIRRQAALDVAQNYRCNHDITIVPNTSYSNGFRDGYKLREYEILEGLSELKPADVVPVSAYKQVMLERDTAVEQLKQIGKDVREVTDDVVHLQRLLSADIAKIVRCKNCKYRSYDEIFECNWCEHEGMVREVKPDFYCGYGEE